MKSETKKRGKIAVILFALIKLSGIGITEASGKLGGNVFSKNRAGAIIRNRVVPNNPQTTAQQAIRAIFGSIASAWRTISQAQRDAWNAITGDYPYQNRLGETKILSGRALFQKLNNNLLSVGLPLLENPLAPQGAFGVVSLDVPLEFAVDLGTLPNVANKFLVNAKLSNESLGTRFVIEMTPPLSPGVKNANSKFVRIFTGSTDDAVVNPNTSALGMAYFERFGNPAIGSRISVRIFTINPNTGEASVPFVDSTIVVED